MMWRISPPLANGLGVMGVCHDLAFTDMLMAAADIKDGKEWLCGYTA
jgi:hypothetical protein